MTVTIEHPPPLRLDCSVVEAVADLDDEQYVARRYRTSVLVTAEVVLSPGVGACWAMNDLRVLRLGRQLLDEGYADDEADAFEAAADILAAVEEHRRSEGEDDPKEA